MPIINFSQEAREYIIKLLLENWNHNPDLRLGQLISNMSYKIIYNCDPFYLGNSELLTQLLKERDALEDETL